MSVEEIVAQYVRNEQRRRGNRLSDDLSSTNVFAQARSAYAAEERRLGLSDEQIEVGFNRQLTAILHDWVRLDGRYYAYWPPFTTALLLPLVFFFGPGVSDVLVTNVLGALSVAGIYLMLRALQPYRPNLNTRVCVALSFAYGLGTCHFYQASFGRVWHQTQISATLFLILAILFALKALGQVRWMLAGATALSLAFLCRNSLLVAAPAFAFFFWQASARTTVQSRYLLWKVGAPCVAILAVAIAVQLGFNKARFGDALDFGDGHLADAGGLPRFMDDFHRYGRFSFHYVPRNVWYYFLNPRMGILGGPLHPRTGSRSFDPEGNSLFLISPFMLYLFAFARRRDDLQKVFWVGALPGTALLMLFYGTGFYQFGQRYLLDTMPFLLLLVAGGMRERLTSVAALLIVLSIAVNTWGTYRFYVQ